MATIFTVMIFWGGEIINDNFGCNYRGGSNKMFQISDETSLAYLREKIAYKIALQPNQAISRLIYRFPASLSGMVYYNRVDVDDDDDLKIIYKTEKTLPTHHAIQMYVETENVVTGDTRIEQTGGEHIYISPYHWDVAPHMPANDILSSLPSTQHGAADLAGSTQHVWESFFKMQNENQCYNEADVAGPSNASPMRYYESASPTHCTEAGPSMHFNETPIGSSSEEDDPESFPYDEDDDEPGEMSVPVDFNVHQRSSSIRPLPLNALPVIDLNEMVVNEGDHRSGTGNWGDEATLEKGFVFKTKDDVVAAVKRYSIKHNRAYRVKDSNNEKWAATCRLRDANCPWKIRSSFKASRNHWEITFFHGPHTCMGETLMMDHPQLDSRLMAADIEEMVMEDASVKIAVLQAHIQSKYSYYPSYKKTWMAKDQAIQNLYGRWDESYNRLPVYLNVLQNKNPGTIVEWQHLDLSTEGSRVIYASVDTFNRVFWSYGPCIQGFAFCRPVLCIDATFLYGKYRGTLMIATGIDGGNHILPVAYAIVEGETESAWTWFLRLVKQHVTRSRRVCIISDRHAAIMKIMRDNLVWEEGTIYHRFCSRHLAANAAKNFRAKVLKEIVAKIAGRYEQRKFNRDMESLSVSHPECITYLGQIELQQWSAAYDNGRRFGIMTTNIAECVNGVLKGVRQLPITALVADTFNRSVRYFVQRREEYASDTSVGHQFSSSVRCELQRRLERSNYHSVQIYSREHGLFNVKTRFDPYRRSGGHDHVVKLHEKTCTCGKFQGARLPCSHVIAACREGGFNYTNLVLPYYKLEHCRRVYNGQFFPLGDESSWRPHIIRDLQPNKFMLRRLRGRPRSTRYHNEMDWRTEDVRPVRCTVCGGTGHNRRTCQSRIR